MNISQQDEFRYKYAGMAMQAMITAVWSNEKVQDNVIQAAKRRGFSSLMDYLADEAVGFADALIAELDRIDKP
jgi:hypothetical protein